jgi:hypothetical protein
MTITAVALFEILSRYSLLLDFALHACSLPLILSKYGNPYAEYMLINSQVANLIGHIVYLTLFKLTMF